MKNLILLLPLLFQSVHGNCELPAAPEIMKACKVECPLAKNEMETFSCGELKEHDPAQTAFKSSACYTAHQAYEKWLVAKASATPTPKTEKPTKDNKVGASFDLVIRKTGYDKKTILAPAGVRLRFVIRNEMAEPDEFESPALDILDYPVPAGKTIVLELGPLTPGEYKYTGDNVTGGVLTVK